MISQEAPWNRYRFIAYLIGDWTEFGLHIYVEENPMVCGPDIFLSRTTKRELLINTNHATAVLKLKYAHIMILSFFVDGTGTAPHKAQHGKYGKLCKLS